MSRPSWVSKALGLVFGLGVLQSAFATPAAAIVVTDFTGTLANQQTAVIAVVGAAFVLLGIVVGVSYIRRAAK